jgi:hypothetical protein
MECTLIARIFTNMSNNISAWQRCSAMGLSHTEFTELTSEISLPVLRNLPEDKSWLIPLCVIQDDALCKMRFMYQSLDEFVDLIHNNTMYKIKDVLTQSAATVSPWMGLLMEQTGLLSMDAIMCKDWNMEKPVIKLSGMALKRRAKSYLITAATSSSIKILYENVMIGPVSSLNLNSYTDDNAHELLTKVWHEFRMSHGSIGS